MKYMCTYMNIPGISLEASRDMPAPRGMSEISRYVHIISYIYVLHIYTRIYLQESCVCCVNNPPAPRCAWSGAHSYVYITYIYLI